MMTEYQKRFCRRTSPAPLVLTARDAKIILACFSHRWLTRMQLQRLSGIACVTRINDRLRRLYDHAFLFRVRAGSIGGGLQPVYTAGEAAVPLIQNQLELAAPEVRERLREDQRASMVLLPHDLQVNDVRISLTLAMERDGLPTGLWLNAEECFDAYAPGRLLRPDGYFQFERSQKLYACYLEVDRGTTSLERWSGKVKRYLDYRDSGAYSDRFGLTRFRVLTTAPSLSRLEHLRAVARANTERSFWFATTTEVVALSSLTESVWLSVGTAEQRALVV